MCPHLEPLDQELRQKGIKETFRGQAWSSNCREWAYYECFLDVASIMKRYQFPDFVIQHRNDDSHSGLELGIVCMQCKDAIIGSHPEFAAGKVVVR